MTDPAQGKLPFDQSLMQIADMLCAAVTKVVTKHFEPQLTHDLDIHLYVGDNAVSVRIRDVPTGISAKATCRLSRPDRRTLKTEAVMAEEAWGP